MNTKKPTKQQSKDFHEAVGRVPHSLLVGTTERSDRLAVVRKDEMCVKANHS